MYSFANFENADDGGAGDSVYHYGGRRIRPHYWVRDNTAEAEEERPALGDVVVTMIGDMRTHPLPLAPDAPEEDQMRMLTVTHVDLHIEENASKHRTDDFVCTSERKVNGKDLPAELVVRRGGGVVITTIFDRPYYKEEHDLRLRFAIGKDPVVTKGTLVELEIEESRTEMTRPDEWRATLLDKADYAAHIQIDIPANCIVGEWNFSIRETVNKGKDENGKDKIVTFQYDHNTDFKILFNPWCKEDGVYMEKEKLLDEYILNPSGCLFRGVDYDIDAKDWNFGQFEENVLESAMCVLRRGYKDGVSDSLSDPVKVSRKIAQMGNSQGDSGVLSGNWSGIYTGGTSPLAWNGSVKILQQWLRTGLPVKYGQCWVYSGIITTVCRSLGIPCRSVTNFSSAHDTDGSISIDEFYRNGRPLSSRDSVWNFHVWNEVWMERPDLVDFPRGWQVIDATPQETSDGIYTCGPCPVTAVRRGDVETPYDAPFVFAEVNADILECEKSLDGSLELLDIRKRSVGKKISTKTPTGDPFKDKTYGKELSRFNRYAYIEERRLDLTPDYKAKEGSEEEREAVHRAHRKSKKFNSKTYPNLEIGSVEFRLQHSHKTMIGTDLTIEFTAKNNGKHDRKIYDLGITASPKTYTGETGAVFHEEKFPETTLKGGEEIICFKTALTPEIYLSHLVELENVRIVAIARVDAVEDEKEKRIIKTQNVRFSHPVLDVECPDLVMKGDKVTFDVSFTNPLDIELTECHISMECNGFDGSVDNKLPNVPPKGEYKDTFILEAVRTKRHAAMFSFDCKQLKDISGSSTLYIDFKDASSLLTHHF